MDTLVPIERQPLGPTENMSEGSWLDRRMRLVTSGLGRKGREKKRLLIGIDSNVAPTEKEGELVQVWGRVEKVVHKPDLEVVLTFPVQGASGTLQMFANCEVYDYDRRNKGEVLLGGENVPLGDLGRFILEDTNVMAMVYWKSSRVVTTGRRWRVAKLWKPDPNGHAVDVFSVTSWTHVNPENPPVNDRSRNYLRGMSSIPSSRASSEPPKLASADTDTTNEYMTNQNRLTEKIEGDSYEDQHVRGRTFSWGTLIKKRIVSVRPTDFSKDAASTNLSSSPISASAKRPSSPTPASTNFPSSPTSASTKHPSSPTHTKLPSSPTPASTKLPSRPTLDAGSDSSVNTTQSLPLCLFAIPAAISQVKQGSGGIEYAVTFTRMGETYEALMMKKYLSALMVDCVTETWLNVEEMLVPGLQVVIDVKNIVLNVGRKWLVFGLYLGKLQRSEASHFINRQVKVNSKSSTPIEDETRLPMSTAYQANLDEGQVYSGASWMKESEPDNSFSDDDGAGDKTCDHKFDYSGAISEIDSTTFSLIGPFGERWINAKLSVAQTNLYVDGVRIQESSDKSSFLKKAKGAMGNLVISKCLKCSDFDLSDDNDLLIKEACLAWFGIDNAPWLQGDLGKVSAFSSINEGKESLAVIGLANSSSKVWYKMSQHTGHQLSINSEVFVWAFRECTEAYYIGAAVVKVPQKPQSRNLMLDGLDNRNQMTWTPLNDCKISTFQDSSNEIEEVFMENSKMNDTGKSIDFEGATKNGVQIEDVNYNIKNEGKIANPSEGSLSSVISPLDLESSVNGSVLFSFAAYKDIENLKPLDTSNDGKPETSAVRTQSRSLPSTTDSEYSEVDYRGTLAQIEAFKKMGSVEKRVAFQQLPIENVSNHLHAGFEIELVKTSDNRSTLKDGNEDSASDHQEIDKRTSDAEVFSPDISPNVVINTEAKTASLEETSKVINNSKTNCKVFYGETENLENFDDSWNLEINKLLLRDDKIANQLESHDDFFKYAKLELTFGALLRDNSMMNLPNQIIDTQFEMILYINDLDSPQLIYSQAKTFDECFENVDWTRTDPVERVGRFTVFGKDSPEQKSTSLLNNHVSADEDLPRPGREFYLPAAEHQTISSLNLLPPIPEEKETCSDVVSTDGSLSEADGCEYSMSWTYTKVDAGTPSPMKIDAEAVSHAQFSAKSISLTKAGARTPPATRLIRYTSTPHLNKEEAILERKFSADSTSSLIHSFTACDTDSGLGDSKNKIAYTENSPFSLDDQAKTTEVVCEEKNDTETDDFTKKSCFWSTPTTLDTVPKESSKLLIKENLMEFLSFTEFPEDRRSEVIERFMKSGKVIS